MKKELRPFHDHVTCDVCGRTILKGERTETYVSSDASRSVVCELCFARAEHAGWMRESAVGAASVRSSPRQERGTFLGRLRRRQPDFLNGDEDTDSHDVVDPAVAYGAEFGAPVAEPPLDLGAEPAPEPEPVAQRPAPRERSRPSQPERRQDPRQVRAVPSTAEARAERALEMFNGSGHARTVSGLARSLGAPWVSAHADSGTPSTVNLVVAWELSWYRYRIDLGDASEPVSLAAKGDEMDDIDEALRAWNGALDAEGNLVIGVTPQ